MLTGQELLGKAKEAMANAYAPYSNFFVGAALLCRDGSVYTGCNVENAAFGAGICAERTALFKAVSEGHKDFVAIAIVGGRNGVIEDFCYPCGICRQVMAEFGTIKTKVYVAKSEEDYQEFLLTELLPNAFNLE